MDYFEQVQKAIFNDELQVIKDILGSETVDNDIILQKDKITGATLLHYAAYTGSIEVVEFLVNQQADLNAKNNRGETPVHIACARKNSEALELMMDNGVDYFPLTNSKWSPLHCCALYNSIECVDAFPFNENQINFQDESGLTALHVACANGHKWMVTWLLKHQADPEIPDNLGRLPVHIACTVGSQSILKELIKKGADLNKTDFKERTVFHYACRSPQKQAASWDLVQYLESAIHVSPWGVDKNGASPILHAIKIHKTKLARQMFTLQSGRSVTDQFQVFLYTVSVAPSSEAFNHIRKIIPPEMVAMTDKYGFTALHYAAEYDRDDRVVALLSMRADINARALNGVTPLHCAAVNGSGYVIEILLENKANVQIIDDNGQNALHLAASKSHIQICCMLLTAGIDKSARDKKGRTALMHLCNIKSVMPEALKLLLRLLEVEPGKTTNSSLLNAKDNYGWTALHYAASRGSLEMIMELVKQGADVCSVDNNKRNALHVGVQSCKPMDALNALCIKTKSAFYQRDILGFLPIHYAATNNNPIVVTELLKRQKCKILPQSGLPYQLTPLHLAAINGQIETAKAIIDYFKSQTEPDNFEDCIRSFESLKLNEDDPNSSFEKENKRYYDPLTSEDNLRRIPLHYAMKYGYDGLLDTLLPVEKSPVLLGWHDYDGLTPMMMASANGNDKCVQIALDKLESVEATGTVPKRLDSLKRCAAMLSVTAEGNSYRRLVNSTLIPRVDINKRGFLHRAAFSNKIDLLRDVIKWTSPSDMNRSDVNEVTPLHLACYSGNLLNVRMLLDAAASLANVDRQESTPTDWAAACGHIEILKYLLKHYKKAVQLTPFSICKGAQYGHFACVELLIQEFPEMVRAHIDDKSALHLAAENGHGAVCKLLIDHGAFLDIRDRQGCTPLMLAAICKSGQDCVDYLACELDCPLDSVNSDGNTAMHLACIYDNPESAMKIHDNLVARDELSAVTAVKNNKNETLLHLAVKMNSSEMIQIFLKTMATAVWEKDDNGRSPLVCMIDNPAVVTNISLLLIEYVKIGQSLLNDSNNSSFLQSEPEGNSNHNRSFNSTGSSNNSCDQGEYESY